MEVSEDLQKMAMSKGFHTKLCSDVDYEGMVIDIYFDDERISSLNYDKGIDNLEIEILWGTKDTPRRIFPLNEFFEILEKAKKLALKCAKEDELR